MRTNEELKEIDYKSEEFEELTKEERIEWLSLQIFDKNIKDVKYVLVTNHIHKQLLDEEVTRTGLYQWLNVFRGNVKLPRDIDDYSEYDLVQVNLSGQDVNLVADIREKIGEESKTKLVANNDYTTEIWENAFQVPNTVGREIINADMLFGTEYYQTTALSELSGRNCFIIPHPADIKRLKAQSPITKKNVLTTIWRRYDNRTVVPHLAVRGHGLTTQLIGYDKNKDPRLHVTTPLYDYVLAGTNYMQYCDQMRESRVVYDPFTYHSYSRGTVDCAALGVPYVGSNRTQASQILYPHTTIDPYDIKEARKLIKKLLTDKKFHDKVVGTAREMSEFYNHENSRERYLVALYESIQEGREQNFDHVDRVENIKGNGDEAINYGQSEKEKLKKLNQNG